jgi:hypothetical protein
MGYRTDTSSAVFKLHIKNCIIISESIRRHEQIPVVLFSNSISKIVSLFQRASDDMAGIKLSLIKKLWTRWGYGLQIPEIEMETGRPAWKGQGRRNRTSELHNRTSELHNRTSQLHNRTSQLSRRTIMIITIRTECS